MFLISTQNYSQHFREQNRDLQKPNFQNHPFTNKVFVWSLILDVKVTNVTFGVYREILSKIKIKGVPSLSKRSRARGKKTVPIHIANIWL